MYVDQEAILKKRIGRIPDRPFGPFPHVIECYLHLLGQGKTTSSERLLKGGT